MTHAEELADFIVGASFENISQEARRHLKARVLDSLGCAIGALGAEPIGLLREQIADFHELQADGQSTLIGGWKTTPDRAAFYNSALVRYLDFNDSYLARYETCHPSDNLGAVLAAAEYAQASGRELLTALAVAYQVQCRLSDVAPVRAKGFDHTTQGAYAVAAGVAKALGLSQTQTANALAICGTAFNALRVTRTGALSHWKGLAYPNLAGCATYAVFLAMRGITGPLEVFEGNKGFMDSIAGQFEIDWSHENLEGVRQTIIKKYNAEIHSQSAIEAVLELREKEIFQAENVESVSIEIFDVAYHIIGGGDEGDKRTVWTKEEADHSLPYIIAAAILDGKVMPEQYELERIHRRDIQELLSRVIVRSSPEYSLRFPDEMPCHVAIQFKNGIRLDKEKTSYRGFHADPMHWTELFDKFRRLTRPIIERSLQREISDAVDILDEIEVAKLTSLLSRAQLPEIAKARCRMADD
jgi:2-methylcitrate dehydratase